MVLYSALLYIALFLVGYLIWKGFYAFLKRFTKKKSALVVLSVLFAAFVIYLLRGLFFCAVRYQTACPANNIKCIRSTRSCVTPFGDIRVGGLRYIPF